MRLLFKPSKTVNESEFLKDSRNRLSSKRLGFLRSLNHWITMGWFTLIWLLVKGKYELAVDLVDAAALATFGFAGAIASEYFGRLRKEKNKQNEE